MDGVAGIVYPDIFQVNKLIVNMLDTLCHRGGEQADTHTYKNIQIGSSGHKISFNEKKTVVAVVDGSIYNRAALYHELLSRGYEGKIDDPLNILVHAYEFWGPTFLEKVDGDFAIVILDQAKERIILARDRIGIKPLYWYHDQGHFIFGSEIKALLATGIVPQTPALDALASYLYFGYIPQDMSPVLNVNKLLPGHYLQFNRNGSKTIHPYWSYSAHFKKNAAAPKSAIIKKLESLLLQSAKERLPANGNVGCFMSGGIGSASIAYFVKKAAENITAFSVGFQGQDEEDIAAAKAFAENLNIPDVCAEITPANFLDDLVKIAWHLDEPIADPRVVATWRMAKLAQGKTEHVYSGIGVDELIASHTRYANGTRSAHPFAALMQSVTPVVSKVLAPVLNYIYKPGAFALLQQSRTNPWQFGYMRQNALFNEQMLAEASPMLAKYFDPEVFLHKFHQLYNIKSLVSSFLYFDVKTRLPDCYVMQYERLTAACGLEWRPPILDRKIVEYLAGLPDPKTLDASESSYYLKEMVRHIFPPSLVNLPKVAREQCLQSWAVSDDLYTLFQQLLNGTLVETGLVSEVWLRRVLETPERCAGAFQHLWAMLMLEIWFQLFINNPIQTKAPEMSAKELLCQAIV